MNHERFIMGTSEYANTTTVHPVGLTLLLLLGVAMLCVPRRHTMIVLFACASFIASGQRVIIFGLDLTFLRLMVVFTWTRILLRGENRPYRWNRLDFCIILWGVASLAIFMISQEANRYMFKLGLTFDALGMYFLSRCLVRDLNDVKSMISGIAIIGLVVSCFFVVEFVTKQNMFSIFGGVPEITVVREGKLRCQGAYAHPILAGCFYASLVPLFAARALYPVSGRILAILGIASSLLIVALCNSSTPIIGVFAAIAGLFAFRIRHSMRAVRWGFVLSLAALQAVMIKPVYVLIGRITLSGGSTGRHRVAIIDALIEHFSEWAVCGTSNIDHWNIFGNDITNRYAIEAIGGGLLQLFLFIVLIVVAFSNVGKLWRSAGTSSSEVMLAWSIGVAFFVHTVNILAITYFGQIEFLWALSLALTAVVPVAANQKKRVLNIPPSRRMDGGRRPKEMAYL